MRRRRLLQASGLGAAVGSAGCLTTLQASVAGDPRFQYGFAALHAADDPYLKGGLGDGTDADAYGELFTQAPEESPVLGEGEARREVERPVLNAGYERDFVLLYEFETTPEQPHTIGLPPATTDLRWSGWRELEVPIGVEPAEYGESDDSVNPSLREAEKLVCTTVTVLVTRPNDRAVRPMPERATVTRYGEDGSRHGQPLTVE